MHADVIAGARRHRRPRPSSRRPDRGLEEGYPRGARCGRTHLLLNQRRDGQDELTRTPLELIDRIASLIPPPRAHRHRYYGALAANSPESESQPMAPKRSPAHYMWAALIARIYEAFPLLCPICGGQMRMIAFITHSAEIRQILVSLEVDSEPPRLSPARGPPLWDGWDAGVQTGEGDQALPDRDLQAQSAPNYEADQRLSW